LLPAFAAILAGGAALAFNRTWWMQSTAVEVYALNGFLVTLVLWSAVKAFLDPGRSTRHWTWTAVALGLSLANHMTALLLVLPVLFLFFKQRGFHSSAWKSAFLQALVALGTACALYLYLPIAASARPSLNWGDPADWNGFLRHVSGGQYRVWMFSSASEALDRLSRFLAGLPSEFSWQGATLGGFGLVVSLFGPVWRAVLLLSVFALNTAYAVNYNIPDLDAYFLLSYAVVAAWIAIGVQWILDRFRAKGLRVFLAACIATGPGIQLLVHRQAVDASDMRLYERYAESALESVPRDALVLSVQWDVMISPALYVQFVKGFRRDVAVVDKELLRRSWYYRQIETDWPAILEKMDPEIADFTDALKPFERGKLHDPVRLETGYRRIFSRLIETNMDKRAVFVAPELVENELARGELDLPSGVTLVPDLFFFRAVRDRETFCQTRVQGVALPFPKRRDRYTDQVRGLVTRMLIRRALYELSFQRRDAAAGWVAQLKQLNPGFPVPEQLGGLDGVQP
jgi:hypothetical protein